MPELGIRRWPQGQPLYPRVVAEIWGRDGFSCELWADPLGRKWIGFVRLTDERVVVKEGLLEFEVEGARGMLGPDDEVFIPARSRHSVRNRGSSTARWFYGYRHS